MGWRFRKVLQSGPFRWTLSKSGVGFSWGVPGLRFGVSPNGQRYISFGIPGTGLYFIKYFGKPRSATGRVAGTLPQAPSPPSAPSASTPTSSPPTKRPWWTQKGIGGGP